MFYNPFVGNSRMQFIQPQQQQYDFSGWGDRLSKIEEGIASLTDQFNSFQPQTAGQNNMVNTPTNTAPEPLETPVSEPEPLGGIESLAPPQNTGFNFDPEGGSLMSQLATAYGGQTHNEQMGRGPAGFTQGFADFFTGEGYYADPRPTAGDAPWSISETPITLGSRFGTKGEMTLDPYGNPQGAMQDLQPRSPTLNNLQPPGPKANPFQYQGIPNDMQQQMQPQIGAGLTGLAAYQSQNKGMV